MPTSTVKFRVMNCEKICQTNNLYWRPGRARNNIFRLLRNQLVTGCLLCCWGSTYRNLSLVFEFLVVEIPDASSPDLSERGLNKSHSRSLASTMSAAVSTEARMVNSEVVDDGKSPLCGEIKDPNVKVTLQNKEIWDKFHASGTEMIITKAGRFVNHLSHLLEDVSVADLILADIGSGE